LVTVLFAAICLIGIFLRVYLYLANRSLFFDEAALALNIVDRSFIGLLKPLDYNQGAPIGYLLSQRAVISLLGNRDYILRLIPLLAGLISVPLMCAVATQYGGRLSALTSAGLFALSPTLVRYSSEMKQYSTDVLMALVLLFIAPKCLEDDAKPGTLVVLGVAGSLAVWFSHPSLFVLPGILLTLGLVFAGRRDLRRLYGLIGVGLGCGISLSLAYVVNLRYLGSKGELVSFWGSTFAPVPPWSDPGWFFRALWSMVRNPAGLPFSEITAGLLTLGIFSLAFRRRRFMLVLLAPFLLTLAASALRKYPFAGRLLLFLVPVLFLLLAEGVDRARMILLKVNRPHAGLVVAFLVVYLLYPSAAAAYRGLRSPPMGEHIKPVMSYVRDHRQSTDLVYVYYGAAPAFVYYGPQYGFERGDYVVGSRGDTSLLLGDIEKLRSAQRVWCVLAHDISAATAVEQVFLLEHLGELGLKRAEFTSQGASVSLYELGQTR
jgi:hypothetical protein